MVPSLRDRVLALSQADVGCHFERFDVKSTPDI
jgi:hypothetical protein